MQNNNLENVVNNRVFPRVTATCPVMYRSNEVVRWNVGLLINFSATGVLFQSTRAIPVDSDIIVRLENGRSPVIPALSGSGKVTRCTEIEKNKYEIACRLNRIDPPETVA